MRISSPLPASSRQETQVLTGRCLGFCSRVALAGFDVDAVSRQLGGEAGVLPVAADRQGQLVAGHEHGRGASHAIDRHPSTLAGPRAAATKVSESSDQGTMSTYTVPASIRSTTPVASSPLCSATSRRTLSRSRSWMWRSTACLAVCAAIRLKSSDGSSCTSTVPSERTTRLRTSSAPVLVSSLTVSSPSGLNARLYAIASAPSTVWSISSNGMPSSLQSALSASDSVGVDGSDCDREPARDNVFPRDVNDHRRASARTWRLHRDSRRIHGDQLSLHHRLRVAAPGPDVDAPPVAQ